MRRGAHADHQRYPHTRSFRFDLKGGRARAEAGAPPPVGCIRGLAKPTSALDARTTRHPGYALSQRKRKLVEQGLGWSKVIGLLRQLRHRGLERVGWIVSFTNAVYNLVRMRTLMRLGVCH